MELNCERTKTGELKLSDLLKEAEEFCDHAIGAVLAMEQSATDLLATVIKDGLEDAEWFIRVDGRVARQSLSWIVALEERDEAAPEVFQTVGRVHITR